MNQFVSCPNPACGKPTNLNGSDPGQPLTCPHCRQPIRVGPAADGPDLAPPSPETIQAAYSPPRAAFLNEPPLQIGRFEVRARLGTGAFSTVYRVYDPQLNRELALKVPAAGRLDTPALVERFLREARAAAQLRHPHIVPVFDASVTPHCYIASAYIDGQPLSVRLSRGGLDFRQTAAVVRDLAEALAYAHDQGIVHRDVKPANVMLDDRGQAHLLDFGLAHRKELSRLTQAGALLGTPAYMAPEQVQKGEGGPLPASDQYSLGALLYELLCGQTPFDGPPEVVLFHALHTEPPAPRRVNAQVPQDLETICLKAMAKRSEDRYVGCQEMADDLRQWLESEPIRARRMGTLERVVRWARRQPTVTGLLAALVLVSALGFAGVVGALCYTQVGWRQADQEAKEAKRLAGQADEAARRADTEASRAKQEANEAKRLLVKEQKARKDAEDNEKVAKAAANRAEIALLSKAMPLKDHPQAVASVAYSPDGKRIVSKSGDKTVKVRGAGMGQELLTLKGHTSSVLSVAYSPDGKRIVSGGGVFNKPGEVKVWDAAAGQDLLTYKGHANSVRSVAYSPDSKRIVSGSRDQTLKVWDAGTGQGVLTLEGHAAASLGVAYSPNGNRIVSGSSDKTLKVWDAGAGQELLTLKGHTESVNCVAYSPDGKRIVSGSSDKTLKVWDAGAGQELLTLKGHTESVNCVAYSPDGKRIVSGSSDKTLKVWDAGTGQELITLKGHTESVICVAYSPDGKRIVSGSQDETVKVWAAERGPDSVPGP